MICLVFNKDNQNAADTEKAIKNANNIKNKITMNPVFNELPNNALTTDWQPDFADI